MQANKNLVEQQENTQTNNTKSENKTIENNTGRENYTKTSNTQTNSMQNQLTPRSLIIGCVGSVIISASSVYCAVKLGSLPWPIIFAAMISLFILKLFKRKKTNLNEVNVTHTAMSAGAMIGGGLAFTIPGIWILNPEAQVEVWQVIVIALCGTVLGLVYTAVLRNRFIEEDNLSYPVGASAAHALQATESGGKQAAQVFGSMGFAAVFAVLRDTLSLLPATLLSRVSIPGVTFGIINSPMMIGVGFLIGTSAALVWFAGGVIGDFLIVAGGSSAGLWDVVSAQGIKSSLGMGAMIGCGIAVIVKFAIKLVRERAGAKKISNSETSEAGRANETKNTSRKNNAPSTSEASNTNNTSEGATEQQQHLKRPFSLAGIGACVVAVVLCMALQLGPVPSVIIVLLTFLTVSMSSQSVGESGINPMEVFGVMVLLAVAAFCNMPQVQLFFVAAVVSVACGLVGDVMNDFKAGQMLGTSARAQWIAQAAGGIVGAVVSALVLCLLAAAFGTTAFGSGQQFISAQAEVVATMISGIPNIYAFAIGAVAVCVLYLFGLPVITLGIGIYLPFTYSLTILVALVIKKILHRVLKNSQSTNYLAAGFLGGESIVGVIVALVALCSM